VVPKIQFARLNLYQFRYLSVGFLWASWIDVFYFSACIGHICFMISGLLLYFIFMFVN